jgi:hypothetical protein
MREALQVASELLLEADHPLIDSHLELVGLLMGGHAPPEVIERPVARGDGLTEVD